MKKVLLTGGSSGIGLAICKLLTQKGYDVIGTARNPEKHSDLSFPLIQLDVTSEDSILKAFQLISERWGGLDILINNAGIGFMGPVAYSKAEHIKQAWETNVFGLMQVTKEFLPLLQKSDHGRIINIGSIGGKMGLPYRGWYSAAKGSLEILGESLAMELKPFGIDVCTLLPGDVRTEIGASRLETNTEDLKEYEASYMRMKEVLQDEMSQAMPAEKVAVKLEKLLRRKRLPLKYSVGSFLHKITPIIKNLLPQRFFQWLILRHYK